MPKHISAEDLQKLLGDSQTCATVSGQQTVADICTLFNGEVDARSSSEAEADVQVWAFARDAILCPQTPQLIKFALYDASFSDWDEAVRGSRPTWQASKAQRDETNIGQIMALHGFTTIEQFYAWTIDNGQEFWAEMLERLGVTACFRKPYSQLVDASNVEEPNWFVGAKLNVADLLLQNDVGDIAIKYQQEGGNLKFVTFGELDALSNQVANGLGALGLAAGDNVGLNTSFNVESVATYLGAIKAGCTVVCVPNTFKGDELDVRFTQIKAGIKLVITQDTTRDLKAFPIYDNLVAAKNAPKAVVIFDEGRDETLQRDQDISWMSFINGQSDKFDSVDCDPDHNFVVHFSSGTSSAEGKSKPPKAIPWKAHMAIKSAVDGHLHQNLSKGKTVFWTTNPGWMMGSWVVNAALMNGATIAIYDGNYVCTEQGEFLEKAKVNMVGVVPAIVKGWSKTGCIEGADLSAVELFSSTGEPSSKNHYFYLMSLKQGFAPVIEYMGGTEIGGSYLTSDLYRVFSPATFSTPAFGTRLALAGQDFEHADYEPNEVAIVMQHSGTRTPAMGLSSELLNNDHHETYFARENAHLDGALLREHGDILITEPNGLIRSDGRAGESFNINGIKTSCSDMEKMIKNAVVEAIDDCAIVGARSPQGGEDIIFAFVKLRDGYQAVDDEIIKMLKNAIKQEAPQLARVDKIVQVQNVSRTASGKIEHKFLKKQAAELLAA